MRPDEIKAIAVAIVDELEKRAKIKQRRGRPCGTGNKMPDCIGSAALGPTGCTCR